MPYGDASFEQLWIHFVLVPEYQCVAHKDGQAGVCFGQFFMVQSRCDEVLHFAVHPCHFTLHLTIYGIFGF